VNFVHALTFSLRQPVVVRRYSCEEYIEHIGSFITNRVFLQVDAAVDDAHPPRPVRYCDDGNGALTLSSFIYERRKTESLKKYNY
jgi:hypothetical protein